jgi:hypothetical protein
MSRATAPLVFAGIVATCLSWPTQAARAGGEALLRQLATRPFDESFLGDGVRLREKGDTGVADDLRVYGMLGLVMLRAEDLETAESVGVFYAVFSDTASALDFAIEYAETLRRSPTWLAEFDLVIREPDLFDFSGPCLADGDLDHIECVFHIPDQPVVISFGFPYPDTPQGGVGVEEYVDLMKRQADQAVGGVAFAVLNHLNNAIIAAEPD